MACDPNDCYAIKVINARAGKQEEAIAAMSKVLVKLTENIKSVRKVDASQHELSIQLLQQKQYIDRAIGGLGLFMALITILGVTTGVYFMVRDNAPVIPTIQTEVQNGPELPMGSLPATDVQARAVGHIGRMEDLPEQEGVGR